MHIWTTNIVLSDMPVQFCTWVAERRTTIQVSGINFTTTAIAGLAMTHDSISPQRWIADAPITRHIQTRIIGIGASEQNTCYDAQHPHSQKQRLIWIARHLWAIYGMYRGEKNPQLLQRLVLWCRMFVMIPLCSTLFGTIQLAEMGFGRLYFIIIS